MVAFAPFQLRTPSVMASREIYKLFVGNLPWTIGHQELRAYFQEFGKVITANVVFDKKTGCSKGFGFVTATKDTYENIDKKDRHTLEGNTLNIQKS